MENPTGIYIYFSEFYDVADRNLSQVAKEEDRSKYVNRETGSEIIVVEEMSHMSPLKIWESGSANSLCLRNR